MATLEMRGKITEVSDTNKDGAALFEYVDGERVVAVDVTISQPGYLEFQRERGMDYWPPRVRFPKTRLGPLVPEVGQTVVALVYTDGYVSKGDGKVYVNLKGRRLEMAK